VFPSTSPEGERRTYVLSFAPDMEGRVNTPLFASVTRALALAASTVHQPDIRGSCRIMPCPSGAALIYVLGSAKLPAAERGELGFSYRAFALRPRHPYNPYSMPLLLLFRTASLMPRRTPSTLLLPLLPLCIAPYAMLSAKTCCEACVVPSSYVQSLLPVVPLDAS